MADKALEERVAAVEQQLSELRAELENGAGTKNWRSTIGMFTGDEVMRQVFEKALQLREEDRRKARRQRSTK